MDIINELKKRAENLEESLIDIHIKTEGKVSLTECYSMPYKIRQIYYKLHNKYVEEQNKKMD